MVCVGKETPCLANAPVDNNHPHGGAGKDMLVRLTVHVDFGANPQLGYLHEQSPALASAAVAHGHRAGLNG
jgi:hypothetical protein